MTSIQGKRVPRFARGRSSGAICILDTQARCLLELKMRNTLFLSLRRQQTLREKLVELQTLTVQEKRLMRGEVFCVLRPQRFLSPPSPSPHPHTQHHHHHSTPSPLLLLRKARSLTRSLRRHVKEFPCWWGSCCCHPSCQVTNMQGRSYGVASGGPGHNLTEDLTIPH